MNTKANMQWEVEEYAELLIYIKDNFKHYDWDYIISEMAYRFDRSHHSIRTAVVSFGQVNLGIESTIKKGLTANSAEFNY